jgi:spoIIIJ-associated protein
MSGPERRFFAASSLSLAVGAAARWYGIDPERLAYRVRDKRHGFVKAPRGVVIEVDPAAPARAAGEAVAHAPVAPKEPAGPPARTGGRPRVEGERPRRAGGGRSGRREGTGRTAGASDSEGWQVPDADSELAAREACSRLLRFAGLSLEPQVRRVEDRLEVLLTGADEPELERRGLALLEDLEHLLPRAIHGLCGRLVRVRIEGAGLRAARERELITLAEAAAQRVLAGGPAELLEPLGPAERRVVHLALADRPGLATESVGEGNRKRVRVSPRPA